MTVFLVHYANASHGMVADFLDVSSFGRERFSLKTNRECKLRCPSYVPLHIQCQSMLDKGLAQKLSYCILCALQICENSILYQSKLQSQRNLLSPTHTIILTVSLLHKWLVRDSWRWLAWRTFGLILSLLKYKTLTNPQMSLVFNTMLFYCNYPSLFNYLNQIFFQSY